MMASPVSAAEVTELLRRIASGELSLVAVGRTWDEVFAGDVTFRISSGDVLVVFNDCDEIDYIDSVVMADGRRGDFDEWANCGEWPFDTALSDGLARRLYEIFQAAPVVDPAQEKG